MVNPLRVIHRAHKCDTRGIYKCVKRRAIARSVRNLQSIIILCSAMEMKCWWRPRATGESIKYH